MTKINLDELRADREAGTGGPWEVFNDPECARPGIEAIGETIVVYGCDDDGEGVHGDHANARRIARLPDLEAAYLEAVDLLEWYSIGTNGGHAKTFLERNT